MSVGFKGAKLEIRRSQEIRRYFFIGYFLFMTILYIIGFYYTIDFLRVLSTLFAIGAISCLVIAIRIYLERSD